MVSAARSRWFSPMGIVGAAHSICLAGALLLFSTGMALVDFELALVGVLLLFVANVIYAIMDVRERLLFLFLHLGIALFLLSRPAVALFDPSREWLLSTPETTVFALWALFLSMVSLFAGVVLYGAVSSFNESRRKKRAASRSLFARVLPDTSPRTVGGGQVSTKDQKLVFIRRAALLCFLVCLVGAAITGYIKLSYMQGKSYEDYYLVAMSDYVPWAIDLLNVMFPYMMCAYLATLPKRAPATACLLVYVASTIPMLIIGSRADFVLACLFAVLYYLFRNVTDKQERWIGRKELVFAAVVIPVGVFVMGLWDYLRAGSLDNPDGFLSQIVDALYKQGVSFTVLGRGYDVNVSLQQLGFKFYTMGLFISNITQGFIGQTFLGCESLPGNNSAELALKGNEYAHTMSYYAHPNYLGGEGYGSSYLLELFADFGYGGIIVGSIILGVALVALSRSIGKRWFWGTVALVSSITVVHMPRGNAMEWISFIWTTRFALAIVLIIVVSFVLSRCATTVKVPLAPRGKLRMLAPTHSAVDPPGLVVLGAEMGVVDRSVTLARGAVDEAKAPGVLKPLKG